MIDYARAGSMQDFKGEGVSNSFAKTDKTTKSFIGFGRIMLGTVVVEVDWLEDSIDGNHADVGVQTMNTTKGGTPVEVRFRM
jgi:hypothetical protein